jgi:hypothetical protein
MVVQPFSRFRGFKAGRFARLCRDLESLERVLAFDLRHFLGGGFLGSLGALAGAAAKHVFHADVFAGSVGGAFRRSSTLGLGGRLSSVLGSAQFGSLLIAGRLGAFDNGVRNRRMARRASSLPGIT